MTPSGWSLSDSAAAYGIGAWGEGYFGINQKGHLSVLPEADPSRSIDLGEVVDGLRDRGISTPVLLRFGDVLTHRLRLIRGAFDSAIAENEYQGGYTCIYPIKVNQQRHVCEEIRDLAQTLGFGLEAGSKPELLAVLGLTGDQDEIPIVCNGFKDSEFIETVVLATKLGRNIVPVVERFRELELLVAHAERYGVRPKIGVRVKLSSRGAGRWDDSAGPRSKFGLFVSEILQALDLLRDHGMLDCLTMLHCHIGSQVSDIRHVKASVTELAHIYAELVRLGAGMTMLDIGGGMGIDYDGSKSASSDSSLNYTLEEYATDVVHRIRSVCDEASVAHPMILSESGRAMVGYASVLITEVIGTNRFEQAVEVDQVRRVFEEESAWSGDALPQPAKDLLEAFEAGTVGDPRQLYHDITAARDEVMSLFNLGYVSLPARAETERLFWALARRLLETTASSPEDATLRELREALPDLLSDIYFCNFSVFQSLTDGWALHQVFPVVPVRRLDERPTRPAVLADMTCDSLGMVERFPSGSPSAGMAGRESPGTILLHEPRDGERYDLAILLVGAYQETLGDLHNLFGDTHAVHLRLDGDDRWSIDEVVEGDTVREVLGYVQYDPASLRRSLRRNVERSVRDRLITVSEGKSLLAFYDSGLEGYTYLED